MATTSAMQQMLAIASGLAVVLGLAGAVCLVSDWHSGAIVLLSSAAATGALWAIQRTFLQRLP